MRVQLEPAIAFATVGMVQLDVPDVIAEVSGAKLVPAMNIHRHSIPR